MLYTFNRHPGVPADARYAGAGFTWFAIGVRTGSLYLMLAPAHGIVIVGKGEQFGKESKHHWNRPELFRKLESRDVLEIHL